MELDLGPFRLVHPFARGAMGEVWRAVHRAQGLPVAVKVLSGQFTGDPRHARQFREEVRAMASLDHPAIVTLLDTGTVSEETAAASAGRLATGAPWLAMELASDGTVSDRAPTQWPEIRDLALTVLDALAHAHARGLVHRDLKPANLLWCGERDPRPGLKLTDFGIALRIGAIDPSELPAGTPQYMAPEQLGGEIQGLGPWTDLYSLGCLVWRLTTGVLPFEGLKKVALVRAHLARPLPPFRPRTAVPHGLEDWLRALLAKRPEDRPQRAADAAAGLVLVDGAGDGPQTRLWRAVLDDESTIELLHPEESLLDDPTLRVERLVVGAPAGVPDWREASARRPPELLGAGLGLFGLREPPVVGRQAEQDLLWDELRAVHRAGTPRAVVLRGPSGAGRTRIGRWMCARADEVGAARVLWCDGAAGGLRTTVERLLRVAGLAAPERERVLAETLGDADLAAAAAAFVDGALPEDARATVGARLLTRGRADRPMVLCVDDAHRDEADLDVVAAILASGRPCLVLLLVEEEDLAARPVVEARIAALRALQLPITPLSGPARRDLLASLLRLDDPLASEVEERCDGNPAFAVELVADWVQRDWLLQGPRGFALRPEVSSSAFPDTRFAVSARRLDRVLEDLGPAAGWDTAMAAALGPDVDEDVWHTACDDPDGVGVGWAPDGLARRALLVERLQAARLVAPTGRGFVLQAHLREAVIRRAREAGRWPHVCATAALALQRSAAARTEGARIGHLLLEARRPAEALPWLLDAVTRTSAVSARRALSIGVDAERAFHLAGLPAGHPAAHALALAKARVHLALGEVAEARRQLPPPGAEPRLALETRLLDLEILLASGAHAEAAALLRTLRGVAVDPVVRGRLLLAESEVLEHTDPVTSLARLEEARDVWSRAGVPSDRMATLTWRQGCRSRQQRDLARARTQFERALEELGPRGDARMRAVAGAALAEVLARLGEPARGEVVARRALSGFDAVGNPGVEARVALALCQLLGGAPSDAVVGLEDALRLARRAGRADAERQCHVALAVAHAVSGAWSRVHDHLKEAERTAGAPNDPVLQSLAEDLGHACKAGGFPQLRARARALVAG